MNEIIVYKKSYQIENTKSFLRHYYLYVIKKKHGVISEEYEFHPGMKIKKTTPNFYNGKKKGRVEYIYYVCERCLKFLENQCCHKFSMLRRNCDVMAGFAFQTISLSILIIFTLFGLVFSAVNFIIVFVFGFCFVLVNFLDLIPPVRTCKHLNIDGLKSEDLENGVRTKRMLGF